MDSVPIKGRALTIITVLATLGAVVVAISRVIGRYHLPEVPPGYDLRLVEDWREYSGPQEDRATGRIRMVVFSDYLCGACSSSAPIIRKFESEFPEAVEVRWRHFPMLGARSFDAALAAECVREGGGFEAFHDALLSLRDSIGKKPWVEMAQMVGVTDTAGFSRCLRDSAAADAVMEDREAGRALGIRGVPSVLVDSLLFFGLPELRYLRAYARKAAPPPPR